MWDRNAEPINDGFSVSEDRRQKTDDRLTIQNVVLCFVFSDFCLLTSVLWNLARNALFDHVDVDKIRMIG